MSQVGPELNSFLEWPTNKAIVWRFSLIFFVSLFSRTSMSGQWLSSVIKLIPDLTNQTKWFQMSSKKVPQNV